MHRTLYIFNYLMVKRWFSFKIHQFQVILVLQEIEKSKEVDEKCGNENEEKSREKHGKKIEKLGMQKIGSLLITEIN